MIPARAVLKVNNSVYEVLRMNQKFQRDVDPKGRPRTVYYGGEISVVLESTDNIRLFEQMIHEDMPTVDGFIEVLSGDDKVCVRRIEFKEAYIYSYGEQMQSYSSLPMTTTVMISPMRLDFNNNMLRLDRLWPRAKNGWQKYVEEKVKYARPEPKALPTPLVTGVKGERTALANTEVEYSVTDYNINVAQSDKDRVKWAIKVDGKQETLKQQGDRLKLTIKPEWIGKEITVMPYLKQPTESVSIKTTADERLSLFFNGKVLTLRVSDGRSIVRYSYKAVSGRPLKDGSFDYSRERQKVKDEGPIPEGEYYINPQEIQYTGDRSGIESAIDNVGGVIGVITGKPRGTFPGGKTSWGYGRIWIKPSEVVIDGVIRDDFSIHGGSEYGSAGCIDLSNNDKIFFEKIEKNRLQETKIKLTVEY